MTATTPRATEISTCCPCEADARPFTRRGTCRATVARRDEFDAFFFEVCRESIAPTAYERVVERFARAHDELVATLLSQPLGVLGMVTTGGDA